MKIVINRRFGGFGLSYAAVMQYAKLSGFRLYAFDNTQDADGKIDFKTFVAWDGKGKEPLLIHYSKSPLRKGKYKDADYFSERNIARDDPILVQVVEEMGKNVNGRFSELKIVEIPDGTDYEIDEYDGMETINEKHRSWS